jgi:hypothetical protein
MSNIIFSKVRVVIDSIKSRPGLHLFLRYTALFAILWLSLASIALHNIIASDSNPFFYANF